jgi:cyclophilin family peptidyl-prolyl cis-trans isomerase
MPRSRKSRNSQNQVKPEWGKNNPQTKAKNQKMLIITGVIAVAAVVLGAFLVFGTSLFAVPSASPSPIPSSTPSITPSPSVSQTSLGTPTPAATPMTSPAGEYSVTGTRILFVTSKGNITIQMRDDKPITTGNFIGLVRHGSFNGTIFHRVIKNFMIQGGEINSAVSSIPDEIGTANRNLRGTIAMAKTDQPNSATSQFFINVVDNGNNAIDSSGTKFDSVYTAFGQVIQGMDIVDAISNVSVGANAYGEKSQPLQTVTLISAIVL